MARTKQGGLRPIRRATILTASLLALTAPAWASGGHSLSWAYHARCGSNRACILKVSRIECRLLHSASHCRIVQRHRIHVLKPAVEAAPPSEYTAFDQCVVARESGGNQYASNGVDESYYQWLPATWVQAQADVGVSFTTDPFAATLAQQTYVFNRWEPSHRSAWPNTVPACGG